MTEAARIMNAWREICREREIELRPPAPLLNPDPTVLIVNAGITPFKATMLAGHPMRPAAIIQPCLRTFWSNPGRFAFDMLTLVGERADLDPAVSVVLAFLARLGFAAQDLICVADQDDSDVIEIANAMTGPQRVETQRGNTDTYWTRWEFGYGPALSGRGLTIVLAKADSPRVSLGNVIIVSHPASGRSYFDIGFGVERLGSVFCGGDEWAATTDGQCFADIMALGFDADQTKVIANHVLGAKRMIEAGLRPGAKGAAYLLRKLVRSAVDLVVEWSPWDVEPRATVVLLVEAARSLLPINDRSMLPVITGAIDDYLNSIDRALATARKWSSCESGDTSRSPHRFRDTLGLPRWAIARLLQ
jgi:hypothetical protein